MTTTLNLDTLKERFQKLERENNGWKEWARMEEHTIWWNKAGRHSYAFLIDLKNMLGKAKDESDGAKKICNKEFGKLVNDFMADIANEAQKYEPFQKPNHTDVSKLSVKDLKTKCDQLADENASLKFAFERRKNRIVSSHEKFMNQVGDDSYRLLCDVQKILDSAKDKDEKTNADAYNKVSKKVTKFVKSVDKNLPKYLDN